MVNWFEDNSQSTGHPLLTYLNHVAGASALVSSKIKKRNPAFMSKQSTQKILAQKIAVILPNPGEWHISNNLFESVFNKQGLTT